MKTIRHPKTHRMTDVTNGNRFVYIAPVDDDKNLLHSATLTLCGFMIYTVLYPLKGSLFGRRKDNAQKLFGTRPLRIKLLIGKLLQNM